MVGKKRLGSVAERKNNTINITSAMLNAETRSNLAYLNKTSDSAVRIFHKNLYGC